MNKILLGVILVVGANQASAIGSIDDLKKVCDFPAAPKEARLINATAFLISSSFVHHDSSSNSYYVDTVALTQYTPIFGTPIPICSDSMFYGEPSVQAGRTGVLIAPNMILTSPHSDASHFNPQQFVVVFRASQATAGGAGCSDFTWSNIPPEDVYFPNATTPIVDTIVNNNPRYDYAVFTLDRNVTNRAPVKIRRSGAPRLGDIVISAGYPQRTAERVDSAAVYDGIATSVTAYRYAGNYLFANLNNSFEGDSGAPIYNPADDVVEAVMSYGLDAWFVTNPGATCSYAATVRDATDANGTITDIAAQIPRNEILVAPLNQVVHVSALGGPNDQPSKTYNITPVIGGPNIVTLGTLQGPSGPPTTTPLITYDTAPGLYTVPATGMSFHINSDTTAITQCGTWDYEMDVQDIGNGGDNMIRHRFEVGLREFSIDSDEDWVVNEISAPYSSGKTYTITNVRPTPTHVVVSQDGTLPNSNLILINGAATTAFDLGPVGSATQTATIQLTLSQTVAAATTLGVEYHGRVSIYHQPFTCTAPSQNWYVYRNLTFKRGEQPFGSQQGPSQIPPPSSGQQYGTAVRFDLDLTGEDANACVGDINLYLGVPTTPVNTAAALLKIQLTAPNGTTGVLWQGNSIPLISPYGSTTLDVNGATSTPALYLDDQVAPPLGPSMLSLFNGKSLKGHWYVDVSTSNATLLVAGPAQLDFTRRASCIGGGT